MEKNHYYLTRVDERIFQDAGKNKREAIRLGRKLAVKEKTSIELWKCEEISDIKTLGRYYIGVLEFPYYLRNCQLTAADIIVNI